MPKNSYFEKVFIINLRRQPERFKKLLDRLPSDWPFPQPDPFEAIDANDVPQPRWWKGGSGGWGCFLSHQRVIEQALRMNLGSMLVLEDDAIFCENFTTKASQFMEALPDDWDYVYLGGQHIQRDRGVPIRINSQVYRPYNVHRAHAYGFCGRTAMEKAYLHLHTREDWGEKCQVDHRLGELHHDYDGGLYAPSTWLVGQDEGVSNIKVTHVPVRFFPDSETVAQAPLAAPLVAVVGHDVDVPGQVARSLSELGINMGASFVQNAPFHDSSVAAGLHKLCNELSTLGTTHQSSFFTRIHRLGKWARIRTALAAKRSQIAGGFHPKLANWLPEIVIAWQNPKLVIVGESMERAFNRYRQLQKSQKVDLPAEKALNIYQINEDDFMQNRQAVLNRLVSWLGCEPNKPPHS